MTALQDLVAEEQGVQPLDELTRRLLSLLHTQADGLAMLHDCMQCAKDDTDLHALLADMYWQQALWIQHLEPQVRKRLRPYSPATPVDPW